VKDVLERKLHKLVCTGQLDLKTAQSEIALNWIEAYQRYVAKSSEVWVNTRSGKSSKARSRFYGTTKQGEFVSELEALRSARQRRFSTIDQ
jgi:hypothetical protein